MIIRALRDLRTFSPEGGEGGDTTAATVTPAVTTTTTPAAAAEPQSFSVDYVRELRAENKGYRLKAQQLEAAATEAKTAAEKVAAELAAYGTKAAKELEAKIAEVSGAAAQRLVRAEIKAGAVASGIAHIDFLKLIDTSAVTVGADGEVIVPDSFWADTKAKFGHLFTQTGADKGTTTNTTAPPKAAPTTAKHASEMTDAEADAALAALTRR